MKASSLVRHLSDADFLPLTAFESVNVRDEGLACDLVSRELTGSEDLNAGLARMLPGQYHLKHHHPHASEFYLILSGECWVHVAGAEIRARPGTAIYIPRNAVHAIKNDTDEVVELAYGFDRPSYPECGLIYDEKAEPEDGALQRRAAPHDSPYVQEATRIGFTSLQHFPGALVDPRDEGLVCELISRDLTASDDLNMGIGRLLPGQHHIKHHHRNASEFYLFTAGESSVYVGGEWIRATKGTGIYLPREMVHAIKNDSAGVVELIYGYSQPTLAEAGNVYDE